MLVKDVEQFTQNINKGDFNIKIFPDDQDENCSEIVVKRNGKLVYDRVLVKPEDLDLEIQFLTVLVEGEVW